MVYSLLSILGTHNREDMSRTLLAMSTSSDSCLAMRQSGAFCTSSVPNDPCTKLHYVMRQRGLRGCKNRPAPFPGRMS